MRGWSRKSWPRNCTMSWGSWPTPRREAVLGLVAQVLPDAVLGLVAETLRAEVLGSRPMPGAKRPWDLRVELSTRRSWGSWP
eukprot:15461537-Alexandrium_andersonii.AAC.1